MTSTRNPPSIPAPGGLASLPLTLTLASNLAAEQAAAAKLSFTAEFPKVQDLAGSAIPVTAQCTQLVQACIRNYLIHAPNGNAYPIYVEVFSNGDLGQFYDVQGTTWTGAPLFANPDQTLRVGRRTYDLYYDGTSLKVIAWREYGAVYWVSNTLTNAVGSGELLAIAEQTAPVAAVRIRPSEVILKPFSVPTREVPAVTTPLLQSIGRVGGLMTTLLLLPLGLLTVFINRRRIRSLRAQVLATVARTSLLGTQLAVLETQLTTAPNGDNHMVTQGAVAYATPQPSGAPFGSRAESERSRRPGARVAVGLALIATTAVYLALDSTRTEQPTDPAAPPTAAVAVLNAGSVPEAAHHLALDLLRHRVHVVGITNLAAAAPAEYEVLYTPGDARQARLLAGILKEQHPLVAPTDLNTTQAAGAEPRLIVVIP